MNSKYLGLQSFRTLKAYDSEKCSYKTLYFWIMNVFLIPAYFIAKKNKKKKPQSYADTYKLTLARTEYNARTTKMRK